MTFALLQQPGAGSPDYAEQVDDILALLHGTYRAADGLEAHAVPGEGTRPQIWILGSDGQSASVAATASVATFLSNGTCRNPNAADQKSAAEPA